MSAPVTTPEPKRDLREVFDALNNEGCAIGAKVAAPDRPVICLLGDGALMFAIQKIMTAVENNLDLPIICVDSGGYGEICNNEIERGIEPITVNLCQPDWVKLAEAFGARGFSAKH